MRDDHICRRSEEDGRRSGVFEGPYLRFLVANLMAFLLDPHRCEHGTESYREQGRILLDERIERTEIYATVFRFSTIHWNRIAVAEVISVRADSVTPCVSLKNYLLFSICFSRCLFEVLDLVVTHCVGLCRLSVESDGV